MTETSSTNHRVVDVLNFLAAHPTEAFTLSELAGHLGMSNGSAHRVLSTLTKARYLHRHPTHKTYSLGVALVAIGQAALEKHRGVEIARREIAKLAEDLKAQCIVTTVVDNEILFLAREGVPQSDDSLYRVGERRPCLPPLNLSYVAWADKATVADYLRQAQSFLNPPMLAYLKKALDAVRRRGFAMAANGEGLRALGRLPPLPIDPDVGEGRQAVTEKLLATLSKNEILLLEPADAGGEGVAYITAPVFSPAGTVAFELTLSGLPDNLTTGEVERYAKRLRAAAAVVTSETYGRLPHTQSA